jgi:hypothetical protein
MDPEDNVQTDDLTTFENEFYEKVKEPEDTGNDTPAETDEPELPLEPEKPDEETPTESDDDPNEEPEEEKPVKKKTFQDRINEVLEGRRKANEELESFKARYAELEAKVAQVAEPKTTVREQEQGTSPPKIDATDESGELVYPLGEYDPKFLEDMTSYQVEKRFSELEARQREAAEISQREAVLIQLQNEWNQKVETVKAELPDIQEKSKDLELALSALEVDPQTAEYVASTIMTLGNGPEVLYYLATNLDEAAEVFTSNRVAATLMLGAIDADVRRTKARPTKAKVSSAPEPPKALARGVGTVQEVPDDTDDLKAFEKKFFRR